MIKPLQVHSTTLRRELPILLAITLIALVLMLDGYLRRLDGFLLLVVLGVVMYWVASLGLRTRASDPMRSEFDSSVPHDVSTARSFGWLVLGLLMLLLSYNFV